MSGLDLRAIEDEFLNQCPAHDIAMPEHGCGCPSRDYRPTMLALVREVEALDAEVQQLRVELAAAKAEATRKASEPGE